MNKLTPENPGWHPDKQQARPASGEHDELK